MKFIENNPIIYLTKKMWKYSAGNRRNVVLFFSLFLVSNSIYFFEPIIVAKMLNVIQLQGVTQETIPTLFMYLGLFFLITFGFWVFHGPARVIENTNAFLVRAQYKKYLLDGVMAFPLEWHTNHHSGDTIDKVEKGTNALFSQSGDMFLLVEDTFRLISSYIALIYFNVHAAYIVFFMVVGTIYLIIRFDKVLLGQYRTLNSAENKIAEKVFDVISNITTVIILRIEALVSSAIYQKVMEPFRLYVRNNTISETKWFIVSINGVLMTILVLGSYFYFNVSAGNAILIGTVYALYGYVSRITDLFFRFAYMYGKIVQRKASVMNAEEIANEFSSISKEGHRKLKAEWKELRIDSLSFSYHTEEGANLHLDNISLVIKHKERVALIGASGSGKTTLLKIIRELYHPSSANVFLDGKRLKEGFSDISGDIALIPQDPEIFTTTIGENITVGVPHEPSYIKKYADMACFSEVVSRLPRGFDSYIYEKGVNLSGGERQRLALARGLMACEDKALILLDEPTSSVDTRNELRVYENIFREFNDKTIIASVHRLHLLAQFDKIYFFDEGKIIASGTLKELLGSSKEFEDLWKKYHALQHEQP